MARKKLTFENAMETLEEIVNQLEAGDIPLNELIDKYNEGMKLSAFCLDELNRAKDAIYAEVDVKDNKIIEKKLDKIILINKVDIIDENGNILYDFPHWKQAPVEIEKICLWHSIKI